jgi:hypothetical protein
MTASQHTIAGTVLTMPVKIRKANQHMAMFSVDADAAQHLIDYSGMQVCRYIPGRAIVVLMLMHYIDGWVSTSSTAPTSWSIRQARLRAGHAPFRVQAPSSITSPSTRRSHWKRDKRFGAIRR